MWKLLLFILIPIHSMGQNQANIWYFGEGLGMDFNSGSPEIIYDGQTFLELNHNEGSSVISDSNGELLFYTNGEKIWNRNHLVMPNGDGLLGHLSSTQSSLILPRPNVRDVFYVFTTDAFLDNFLENGFRYSVVDMCLDDEMGDVVPEEKNILLQDFVAEKLTAVLHSNGIDYWVIVHGYDSDAFYAFLLTEDGLSDPVMTNIGAVHESSGFTHGALGQMKASPDGTWIGIASGNDNNHIELFDFDSTTGILSNHIALPREYADSRGYSLSFSPDSEKVYFQYGSVSGDTKTVVYQFDLSSDDPDAIIASETLIHEIEFTYCIGALQLGPDDKIYMINCGNAGYIDVIHAPNELGLECDYVPLDFGDGSDNFSYGLPNFLDSFAYSNGTTLCSTIIVDVDEQENWDANFSIQPMPIENTGIINFTNPNQLSYNFFIYDVQGRMVKSISGNTGEQIEISSEGLNKGLYLFQMTLDGEMVESGKLLFN